MKVPAITNKERLRILLQPWITTYELAQVMGRSKETASITMQKIHKRIIEKGKSPIRGYASAKEVIEYLEIDLEELIRNVRIESELCL